MIKDIKVAVIQAKVPANRQLGEKQVRKFVKKATSQLVDMVGLPEDCVATYDEVRAGYDAMKFLSSVAKENMVYLFGATAVLEKDGIHDRGFLFDREGKLVSFHDKIVLTPLEEQNGLVAGKEIKVFDTEFGKMAILVCKDSFHRYSAWFFDKMRKAGTEIVLVPTFSLDVAPTSLEMWLSSIKALAKWFQVYIVSPGTVGENFTKFKSHGHANIISPKELVIVEGSYDRDEILRATLDTQSLEESRTIPGPKWQPADVPEFELVVQ